VREDATRELESSVFALFRGSCAHRHCRFPSAFE
jgi:hypothetical protein